jgi:hypothetical protein
MNAKISFWYCENFSVALPSPHLSASLFVILVRLTAEDCRVQVIMHNVYGLENNVLN